MMKTRLQIGWLVAGLAAVAVLLVVVAFAIGVSAGPDEPAPGPEEYHIYDGRAGIQIEAEVINASRAVAIVEDPQYIGAGDDDRLWHEPNEPIYGDL